MLALGFGAGLAARAGLLEAERRPRQPNRPPRPNDPR
jgi:hypothetical protein